MKVESNNGQDKQQVGCWLRGDVFLFYFLFFIFKLQITGGWTSLGRPSPFNNNVIFMILPQLNPTKSPARWIYPFRVRIVLILSHPNYWSRYQYRFIRFNKMDEDRISMT